MNVTQIPNKEQDAFQAELEKATRQLENMIKAADLIAKARRTYYLAFLEQGFTEEQALELCKHV